MIKIRVVNLQIEEIRFYQIDHFSYFERSTNHLISKVCNLFAIIVRALQIYQKQLSNISNENSDKLLQFVELIVSGIVVCIEMKIFDEDDMLIKVCSLFESYEILFKIFQLLLEKSDEFTESLRKNIYNEEPVANEMKTINSLSSTSLTKVSMFKCLNIKNTDTLQFTHILTYTVLFLPNVRESFKKFIAFTCNSC